MKILFVFLQFGTSMAEPLSTTQLTVFWGVILSFVGLFFLFLFRTNKIINAKSQTNIQKTATSQTMNPGDEIHDEAAAAIALAIHMYQSEIHDKESFTITLKKVSKIYSPWSSKIYGLRKNPR